MKRLLFLCACIVIVITAHASDSTMVARKAIQQLVQRPSGLSEDQAAYLMSNPNQADSIIIKNVYSIQGFAPLPFTGNWTMTSTVQSVRYENGWVLQDPSIKNYPEFSLKRGMGCFLTVLLFFMLVTRKIECYQRFNSILKAKDDISSKEYDYSILRQKQKLPIHKSIEFLLLMIGTLLMYFSFVLSVNGLFLNIVWWFIITILPSYFFNRWYATKLLKRLENETPVKFMSV